MDNFLHYNKDSCIDEDFMLSRQAGDTLDDEKLLNGFEMSDSNISNDISRSIRIPDNTRLISESPQQEVNLDLSNSLVDSVMNNPDFNFLEGNILQDPSLDDHPFNHVGTSFDDSSASQSLQFNNNGLHDDYTQRQLQDEFEAQMERDALSSSADRNIPDTSFQSANFNDSIENLNQTSDADFAEPVKDVPAEENTEAAILATTTPTDYRIRFSPLPQSILNELKLQRKREKKAKKREKREENKAERRQNLDNSKQSNDDSPSQSQPQLKLKKIRLQRLRSCATCNNDIFKSPNLIHERTVYCSIACLKNMVVRCRKCCKPNDKITFMDEAGTLIQLPNAQIITTVNLEEFLMKEPYVKPFVDFVKLEEDEPKSKFFDVEKGLKKEDAVRAAVKQSFHEQLMKRAKKSKVGVSRKATKEFSDQIEIELYRVHKSVKTAKYKSWCADFLYQVTNDDNMFFKNVVTNVYTAKKLVTLTKEQMMLAAEEPVKLNGVPVNSPIKGLPQNRLLARIKPTPKASPKAAVSAVDMILGEEGADTTLKHNSHEFDSNCQICLRKVAERKAQMELIEKDREEEMEDRKRRKELGKNRKRENKSPPPRSSRWEKNPRRSLERQSPPRYDDNDFDFDDPFSRASPRRNSPRRSSPRRDSPRRSSPRRNRRDSPPRDFHRSQSFNNNVPPRHDSPPRGLIRTPPPGVSPDRLQIRTISPQPSPFKRSPSPRSSTFRRSASPQHSSHSPPFHFQDARRGGPPMPYGPGQFSRPMRPLPPRFAEFGSRGAPPRPAPRPFYDISWTPGMPRPMLPPLRGIRPGFDPVLEESWRREEQWRPRERPHPNEFYPPQRDERERYMHEMPPSPVLHPSPSPPHQFHSPVYHQRSPSPLPNPWIRNDRIIWNGKVEGESFSFQSSLQLISNPIGFKLSGKLPEILPIKARVRPEPMWDFMKTVKSYPKFQIIVGIFLKEESGGEGEKYYRCFFDLKKTVRCGVFDMPKELRIKEAYLFQLAPSEPLPPVLLPIDGPGLPEVQQQKGILAMVIIKYIDDPFIIEIDQPKTAAAAAKEEEEQVPQTLQEVLDMIERIDHPGELIKLVSGFIQRGNLTIEDKQTLQERCRAKIEKQRNAPAATPSRSIEQTPRTQPEQEEKQQSNIRNENEPKNFELSPIENLRPSSPLKTTSPKTSKLENYEESQLQIDESHEDEETSLAKTIPENPDNANSNHSGRESGEMRSESGEIDMEISDDEGARHTRNTVLLPPPPPPPEIPPMFMSAVAPPPPPPPPEQGFFSPGNADSSRDFSQGYSNSEDVDMEEGELNPLTPPNHMHQQFQSGNGRGKNNKKNKRGGRGGRGGGRFNNLGGPSMPLNNVIPPTPPQPQNYSSPVRPDWRMPLPPQEEMYMSIRGSVPLPPQQEMFMSVRGSSRPPAPRPRGPPPPRMMRSLPPIHGMNPMQQHGPPHGYPPPSQYSPNFPPRRGGYPPRGPPPFGGRPPYPRNYMF